jgi:hypothetical protein
MDKTRQAGFVHSRVMDLAFLLAIIVGCLVLWSTFRTTVIEGDFTLAFFMLWLVATAIAGWRTRDQTLLLRVPAGSLAFLGLALVLMSLSWWSGSKLVSVAEAAVAAVAAVVLGEAWSKRLALRLQVLPAWYLDQSINLVNDLLRWTFACIVAWFVVGLLPLLLVAVLPLEDVVWGALTWASLVLTWYLTRHAHNHLRLLKLPLGLWAMAVAALLLRLCQQRIMGPMEAGSVEQIAYGVYQPVVAGLFMEIVVIGCRRRLPG